MLHYIVWRHDRGVESYSTDELTYFPRDNRIRLRHHSSVSSRLPLVYWSDDTVSTNLLVYVIKSHIRIVNAKHCFVK